MKERFVLFSRIAAFLYDKRHVNAKLVADYDGLLEGQVKPWHTPLPVQWGIVKRNTGQKTCQKRVCYLSRRMDNSSIKLTKVCVLLDVSHVPPVILSVFSYSWSSEKKRVRLQVRPRYFLQSWLSKDEQSYNPLAVSFPCSFILKVAPLNLDALKMLLD